MRCLVTAGPTVEPLDSVRRLTNHSTGTLGTDLANHLAGCGHDVLLLRSRTATAAPALHAVTTEAFATAADLLGRFEAHATQEPVAIFHAAAVGDFQVGAVFRRDDDGRLTPVHSGKFSTRDGSLLAELRPTPKILAQLRDLYPKAWITGWKYEVDGTRDEVLQRARAQLQSCRSDAVVANGPAHGLGFTWLTADREQALDDGASLNRWLNAKLAR
ncbi:MAG: Phosphopantothenoylcysteine synthetase/decarboxylase [Verrucomicrobiota bacterium]|jgi:phosphopantothenoylcysteine synthetase/decarboxylase